MGGRGHKDSSSNIYSYSSPFVSRGGDSARRGGDDESYYSPMLIGRSTNSYDGLETPERERKRGRERKEVLSAHDFGGKGKKEGGKSAEKGERKCNCSISPPPPLLLLLRRKVAPLLLLVSLPPQVFRYLFFAGKVYFSKAPPLEETS